MTKRVARVLGADGDEAGLLRDVVDHHWRSDCAGGVDYSVSDVYGENNCIRARVAEL